ncbi:SDR family oxidoreductase [Vibrio tritonius]|uniref:SDR family oxidoreductase n=1 Tax=Vibrio tritonius TaxID=1435069 RepID=A0ABS7YUT3_9VIBR|nr:SDR family NAD(P)-dependent oxidoreductase [Vibrio tritonius]MCA2018080.1 SDR family oxidoreductase [Vibrio tritonius]
MKQVNQLNFLVTGATSGIGKLLTQQLINMGANVAFCGRSPAKMDDLLQQIGSTGNTLYHDSFDATDFAHVKQFVANAHAALGGIDVLVNCAGANTARSTVADLAITDLQNLITLNTVSPFVFMQEVYNLAMKPREQGTIINVLSTVCQFANENIGAYTAAKSGFDALTQVFRKEVRPMGVKVCALYPGGVDTPFRSADRPEYLDAQSVCDAILFMATQEGVATVDELTIRPLVERNFR